MSNQRFPNITQLIRPWFLGAPVPPVSAVPVITASVKTALSSNPLPGDGTSTNAFSIMHTSATGHRLIQCSFTGTCDWDTVPKPGAGLFATITGSNFIPIVGGWEEAFLVETGPFPQIVNVVLNNALEPVIPAGAGVFGQLGAVLTTNFDLLTQNVAEWSLADGAILTYLGNAPLNVLVTMTVTVEYQGVTPDQEVIAVAKNGDLIGVGVFDAQSLASGSKWARVQTNTGGPDFLLTCSRVVTLNAGDTVEPVFGQAIGAASALEAYTMTLQAMSEQTYDGTTLSGSFIAVAPAAIGVAEEVDIVFQFSAPGEDPNDQFIWAGTATVQDYIPS